MISLPVTDCNECGACCLHLSTPPCLQSDWDSLPEQLMDEIRQARASGRRDFDGLGCIWFDHQTRRCRNYDHRPQACKDFEVGGEDCLRVRKRNGVKHVPPRPA